MIPTYTLTFIRWSVMSTILVVVVRHFGEGLGSTLVVGVPLWLCLSATVCLTTNRFSSKALSLWAIYPGYQLGSIAQMAVRCGILSTAQSEDGLSVEILWVVGTPWK